MNVNGIIRKWMARALSLFFITSILGLLLRLKVLTGSPALPYKNLLHAHSHTALLGYGFLFISGVFIFSIIRTTHHLRIYLRLGFIYFVSVIGMAISFMYQSYGAISISFSTIVMIVAYIMVIYLLKDLKRMPHGGKNPLISWSLYWFFLSTAGIWVLGPVSVLLGKMHDLYFLSIQFFLHFQFNGWFIYAALGLLVHLFQNKEISIKVSSRAIWLLNISVILTYFHSVTYVDSRSIFFLLNSTGVMLQIAAFYLILIPISSNVKSRLDFKQWHTWILITGIGCLILKVFLQGLVTFPSLAVAAYTVREFIVGYIHLILLGGMTLTVAGFLLKTGVLVANKWSQIGWVGLTITFILMEIVLFGHAIQMWQNVGNAGLFIKVIYYTTIPFPFFTGCIVFGLLQRTKPGMEIIE